MAVVAGDELTLSRVEGRQSLGPGWVSGISQALAASLWSDPATVSLTRRAVETYARRREALSAALAAHGIEARARSGINLWIEVPDEDAAVRGLLADGWAAAAGSPFRLEAGPAVRITTAALERGRRRASGRRARRGGAPAAAHPGRLARAASASAGSSLDARRRRDRPLQTGDRPRRATSV